LFVADEKKMVDTVFNNAIDSLSDEDKKLPQVWYFYAWITTTTAAVVVAVPFTTTTTATASTTAPPRPHLTFV